MVNQHESAYAPFLYNFVYVLQFPPSCKFYTMHQLTLGTESIDRLRDILQGKVSNWDSKRFEL